MKSKLNLAVLLVTPLLLSACALTPKVQLAEPVVPEVNELEKNLTNSQFQVEQNWWINLGDTQLNTLMDKALKASPSLSSADARMQAAKALFEANRAVLIPQIGVGGQVSRQQLSQNYIFLPGMPTTTTYGLAAGSLQWSLDVWGKQKKLMSSAGEKMQASQASYEAAKLMLASTIANVYIDYDRAAKSLALAQSDTQARRNLLNIALQRKDAGIIDDAVLEQSRIDLNVTKIREDQASLALKQLQHQLAVLAGEGPSWGESLATPHLNPAKITQNFPDKIPADLLARRADLQALLSNVRANRLEVDAAKLDYLPNIDLQANFGYQAYGFENILSPNSQMFSIGPVFNLPIFDGGRIDANVNAKQAARNQAISEYHESLLQSLRQAADGIEGIKIAQKEVAQITESTQSMQNIFNTYQARLTVGIASQEQIDLLQTNLVRQQQALVDAQGRLFAAHVSLVQALGGGYSVKKSKN